LWRVETEHGEQVLAQFLITAVGCLSAAQVPQIAGLEDFKGRWYHTGQWPHEGVDFTGLRVGVVGTGSSGIQSIPVIAQQAAHLTVFQRTPNFSVPARNAPLSPAQNADLKANIKTIRESCRWSTIGQPYDWKADEALKQSPETLRAQFEADWAKGGFEWMFGSFCDLLADPAANALAAEHVEIATADPEALFAGIRHAGSVFLGRHTPEAIGDYVAGPNHVLPTGRRARFASGLSVLDFMKRTSFLSVSEGALGAVGPAAIALAEAEGLAAHARSIELRLGI
jgi:hypothetical protein